VVNAWQLLLTGHGRRSIGDIAGAVEYGDRHLGTPATEVGLTPETAARVIRFDRARRALQRARATKLGDLAASYGYYDQSHLVRDFVDFAGRAPSRWLREEFGNVQAGRIPTPQTGPHD